MDPKERRIQIASRLEAADKAVSASTLAGEMQVSRQIIVGDIAILRAEGMRIQATPRGYVLESDGDGEVEGYFCQVACRHDALGMRDELYAIVDQGCSVVDVIVSHPLYGQLTGPLDLSNRFDVDNFIARVEEVQALPISMLTDGVHLHTIRAKDEAACARVRAALGAIGVLIE